MHKDSRADAESTLRTRDARRPLSEDQLWRRHQFRHLAVLVTMPAVLLGTASIAAAYGSGLMTRELAERACEPVTVPAPPAGSFTTKVLNASGQNGAARVVATDLARRGFNITEATTAPPTLYVKAPARIHHGSAGLDQALLAARTIDGAQLENDGRPGTCISVVLGADFSRLTQPSSSGIPLGPPPTVSRPCR